VVWIRPHSALRPWRRWRGANSWRRWLMRHMAGRIVACRVAAQPAGGPTIGPAAPSWARINCVPRGLAASVLPLGTDADLGTHSQRKRSQIANWSRLVALLRTHRLPGISAQLEGFGLTTENRGVPGSSPGLAIERSTWSWALFRRMVRPSRDGERGENGLGYPIGYPMISRAREIRAPESPHQLDTGGLAPPLRQAIPLAPPSHRRGTRPNPVRAFYAVNSGPCP
jgi:hypothetical protein